MFPLFLCSLILVWYWSNRRGPTGVGGHGRTEGGGETKRACHAGGERPKEGATIKSGGGRVVGSVTHNAPAMLVLLYHYLYQAKKKRLYAVMLLSIHITCRLNGNKKRKQKEMKSLTFTTSRMLRDQASWPTVLIPCYGGFGRIHASLYTLLFSIFVRLQGRTKVYLIRNIQLKEDGNENDSYRSWSRKNLGKFCVRKATISLCISELLLRKIK